MMDRLLSYAERPWGLGVGVFGVVGVMMMVVGALVDGRPTVRANAAFGVTALSSASPIEPRSGSRPYGLQSHFAKGEVK